MRFNIDDYNGRYAMHCDNAEQAAIFCQYLHDHERKWINGQNYVDSSLKQYIEIYPCYLFNNGQRGSCNGLKEAGYTVLEFSNFDWDDGWDDGIDWSIEDLLQL